MKIQVDHIEANADLDSPMVHVATPVKCYLLDSFFQALLSNLLSNNKSSILHSKINVYHKQGHYLRQYSLQSSEARQSKHLGYLVSCRSF